MTFQPAHNVLECRLNWTHREQQLLNIFHLALSPTNNWSPTSLDHIASDFLRPWIEENGLNYIPADTAIVDFRLTDLTSQTAPQKTYKPWAEPLAGYWPELAAPGNVTVALKLKTANLWHGGSGRIYWPSIPLGTLDGDRIAHEYLDGIVASTTDWLLTPPYVYSDCYLCVLSRTHAGARRPEGVPYPVVEIVYSDDHVDSQRARLTAHRRQRRRSA